MKGSLEKLRKLRGRSREEWRVRAEQSLHAFAERRGLSRLARVPSDQEFFKMMTGAQITETELSSETLLTHFRSRTSPRFFASFNELSETISELRRRWPQSEEIIIASAQRILHGRFNLLGHKNLRFGDSEIDWHLEPISGKRAPLLHWSEINYLDPNIAGDKKVTWELNRQQYFATLGRAYLLTRDEVYAETFARHLASWMEQNPPKLGINWASSLEIAFRSISWLWAFYFFKDSQHLTESLFLRALKSLYLNGRHLESYLSTYFSPNTHLTGEALGLYYLGTLLPELDCAAGWRETGKKILIAELERHVRTDGTYFEQSSYYHRYTADFYTHFLLLARVNGESLDYSYLEEKLSALLDHLMYIMRPDGLTPLFGDDDGGRLVMLNERAPNDFRAALSTGAALFERADYKYVAQEAAHETLWLTGRKGLAVFDAISAQPPASTSRAFANGGYYVMRDGWTEDANYLLIDCGPHGAMNCGHAHADALSFELASRGRTYLVDPGTYTYTGSQEMRDYFRSSEAHNTLTIDEESSSVPAGPFSWKHIAKCSPISWLSRERFDFFEGEHDGYARLASPAKHRRSFLFIKNGYWVMRDHVSSEGAHSVDLNFHFAADSAPEISQSEVLNLVREGKSSGSGLKLFAFGEGGSWRTKEGWVSDCYGARRASAVEVFSARTQGTQEFVTFLIPQTAAEKTIVRALEAISGQAFEVEFESANDLLILGTGREVNTSRVSTDFEWAWMRFARATSELAEIILLGGQSLVLDGMEIVRTQSRVGFISLRRAGHEVHVQTDASENLQVSFSNAKRMFVNGREIYVREDEDVDSHIKEAEKVGAQTLTG